MRVYSMRDIVSGKWFRSERRETVMKVTFAALVLLLDPMAFYTSPANAGDGSFGAFPFVVHCEGDRIHRFFYLSKIGPDGVAVYMTPDRQAGTISIDGTAKRILDEVAGTCSGKTLDQLRSAGQVYDMQPVPH